MFVTCNRKENIFNLRLNFFLTLNVKVKKNILLKFHEIFHWVNLLFWDDVDSWQFFF